MSGLITKLHKFHNQEMSDALKFANNVGVIFQSDMSTDKHISAVVKFCFRQLCNFHRICPFISKTAAITLANALVHSHLDYCNSLFYGLSKYYIHCL